VTHLPPESRNPASDRLAADWQALLAGEGDPGGSSRPGVFPPAAGGAPTTGGSEPERQPMTRREAREAEQRRLASAEPEPEVFEPQVFESDVFEPEVFEPEVFETAKPSRADRRAAASEDYRHERPKRRGGWGCLIGLVVVGALVAGAYFFLQGPITALIERFTPAADYSGSGTGEIVFMIHDGDAGSDIAENLVDQGVTASYDAFYDLLLKQTPEPEFHPGAYRLAEKMSSKAALAALLDDANKLENTFVIPEGTALPEVLVAISEGSSIPLEQLQAAAAEPPANYGLPAEATTLEGFLFPATYTLDPNSDAHGVLQTLVNRQFEALDAAGVPADQRWRTIVLASIVQREAGSNLEDFPKVARVFQNRLDQGINLESDATVAYGTGNKDTPWTTDEERADASNLYNTYANPGLPIGPIGNPGDVAINAVLNPAPGDWLFFVTVNFATGETVFSTTVEEHEAAVARLQEWCAASEENAAYCE
jgi:peptidoglycan lytic transglycosylase G